MDRVPECCYLRPDLESPHDQERRLKDVVRKLYEEVSLQFLNNDVNCPGEDEQHIFPSLSRPVYINGPFQPGLLDENSGTSPSAVVSDFKRRYDADIKVWEIYRMLLRNLNDPLVFIQGHIHKYIFAIPTMSEMPLIDDLTSLQDIYKMRQRFVSDKLAWDINGKFSIVEHHQTWVVGMGTLVSSDTQLRPGSVGPKGSSSSSSRAKSNYFRAQKSLFLRARQWRGFIAFLT